MLIMLVTWKLEGQPAALFLCCVGAVSWQSKRQKCVALSTTESEYVAGAEAVKELIWLQQLFMDLVPSCSSKPVLYMDNQSAIRLVKNPEFHKRTKHIDVKFHFIREKFQNGSFELEYASSDEQVADIFTKALSKEKFEKFRLKMNLIN